MQAASACIIPNNAANRSNYLLTNLWLGGTLNYKLYTPIYFLLDEQSLKNSSSLSKMSSHQSLTG